MSDCRVADSGSDRLSRLSRSLCRIFNLPKMWSPYGYPIVDLDMNPVQDLKRGHRPYLGSRGLASYIHGKSQRSAVDSEPHYLCNRPAEQLTTIGGDA